MLGSQAPVVGEVAVPGVGVPGGHPAVLDDLGDRAGPAAGVVVAQQRERRRLAGPVARLALGLDDRGDVGGVGHLADLDRPVLLLASRQASATSPCGAADPRGPSGSAICGSTRSIGQPTTSVAATSTGLPARIASRASVR